MSCLTKICGITSANDALMVANAGADYLGVLVNVPCSPRSVDPTIAKQVVSVSPVPVIMLAFDHPIDQVVESVKLLQPAGVQLAGNENNEYVQLLRGKISCELWKSIHIAVLDDAGPVDCAKIIEAIDNLINLGVDALTGHWQKWLKRSCRMFSFSWQGELLQTTLLRHFPGSHQMVSI